MNIFLFCVKLLFDPHVVKMPLETAQLLYSAWWVNRGGVPTSLQPYKCTHRNHPSAVWVRSSPSHYEWLCRYGLALCREYTFRYGRVHKCQAHIESLRALGFPSTDRLYVERPPSVVRKFALRGCPRGIFWFPLAMPDKYVSSSVRRTVVWSWVMFRSCLVVCVVCVVVTAVAMYDETLCPCCCVRCTSVARGVRRWICSCWTLLACMRSFFAVRSSLRVFLISI